MSLSIEAPTLFLQTSREKYAYRRFGKRSQCPLLLLQHFTGTLDNWDPALTDALAAEHDLILFDNAGIGRSTGSVPKSVGEMAEHVHAFLDGLEITTCDVLGFSLGGMIAQQMVLNSPTVFRKIILAGTAPRGGTDIMHLDKPSLGKYFQDRSLRGYEILQKIFFAPTDASQQAGKDFVARLAERQVDREPPSGPEVAQAQLAAFRDWEQQIGEPFSDLKQIQQPTLIVNGVHDEMIPPFNSYRLIENLPNAVLQIYPDAGHGSIFQWHSSFARQVSGFLASDSPYAPF
ncbi:alpha/beta fold hydrolase [Granulicella arctica]|uniref:Pimeloyl-ACP methyl ester carboxylesterase n=1 Tax=Granulicella arctica TaxID=940613 RepID=A0A7Y9TFQ0_9BACT|nr:alpha/beta hydrolase [Granulicella arctica]NYF79031.1 pimeloyl-ACP methyl ester carboxylesterase [Granulicella arctica]